MWFRKHSEYGDTVNWRRNCNVKGSKNRLITSPEPSNGDILAVIGGNSPLPDPATEVKKKCKGRVSSKATVSQDSPPRSTQDQIHEHSKEVSAYVRTNGNLHVRFQPSHVLPICTDTFSFLQHFYE